MIANRSHQKKWRDKNKDKIAAYKKEWKKRNPDKDRTSKRRNNLRSRYGISIDEFNAMQQSQNNKCASCEIDLLLLPAINIHLDHCHQTGRPRAILCSACNISLGLMGEDPNKIQKLVQYAKSLKKLP